MKYVKKETNSKAKENPINNLKQQASPKKKIKNNNSPKKIKNAQIKKYNFKV